MLAFSIAMLTPLGAVNAPATNTKISVAPDYIEGLPGDLFPVFINIENVEDLYAFGFSLKFAPHMKTIVVTAVDDGGFLYPDPYITYSYNRFEGILQVSGTLIGVQPGVSGMGTLIIVEFLVAEGGDSELHLFDAVLFDSNLGPMPCNTFDGYYKGPLANLVRKELTARDMQVGETIEFMSSVKNEANVPLYMRVRFDMMREDGLFLRFYSNEYASLGYLGPTYTEYKYVTGWEWHLWDDWDKTGDEPWLGAVGDDNYIGTGYYCYLQGFFGFEDLVLPPGMMIYEVVLEAYTIGTYDEECDLDAMCYGTEHGYDWLGSLYCGSEPGWVTPRWIGATVSDVCPEMLSDDPTDLNNLMVGVHYWTADGEDHDYAIIDAMRLKITYGGIRKQNLPQYVVVPPNKVVELPPVVWDLGPYTVGKYHCQAIAQYKFYDPADGTKPSQWIDGKKISNFAWWVGP